VPAGVETYRVSRVTLASIEGGGPHGRVVVLAASPNRPLARHVMAAAGRRLN
jgi:hypothetical protein